MTEDQQQQQGYLAQQPPRLDSHTSASEEQYEWSFVRVSEQVTINVVSAFIIAIGGIILATFWQGGSLLLQSLLHVPSELSGIIAFVLLGMVLMLLLIIGAIILFIKGLSPKMVLGMFLGQWMETKEQEAKKGKSEQTKQSTSNNLPTATPIDTMKEGE